MGRNLTIAAICMTVSISAFSAYNPFTEKQLRQMSKDKLINVVIRDQKLIESIQSDAAKMMAAYVRGTNAVAKMKAEFAHYKEASQRLKESSHASTDAYSESITTAHKTIESKEAVISSQKKLISTLENALMDEWIRRNVLVDDVPEKLRDAYIKRYHETRSTGVKILVSPK